MATRFFLCTTCGNVVVKAIDSGVKVVCCGKEMQEITPKTSDTWMEKHLPVVEHIDDCTVKVKVGSIPHPMTKEHQIVFIYLETEHGGQIQYLDPEGPAEAYFCGCKDKPVAVYEYCNLHGLWKTEIRNCPGDTEIQNCHGDTEIRNCPGDTEIQNCPEDTGKGCGTKKNSCCK